MWIRERKREDKLLYHLSYARQRRGWESNPGPTGYKPITLNLQPTLLGETGLEPAISAPQMQRLTKLAYSPVNGYVY